MMKRPHRSAKQRTKGQALVEFAFTIPVLAVFIFVVIELSLVFITFYSETRMARESARWLAIRSSATTDAAFAAQVQSIMLPGLVGGAPTLVTTGTATIDTEYDVGRMRIKFTPCLMTTNCLHAKRAPGETLYVQMTYDVSNLLFLPTTWRLGQLVVKLPTQLPSYKVSVMVE
jgi:Flp pilus assembly protein TadG